MYYIGIDGGGTKSELVLMDGQQTILSTAISQATNISSHGVDFVRESLKNGLIRLLKQVDVPHTECVLCLASAGVDQPSDKIAYQEILTSLGYVNFSVVNDSEAALSAGTKGEDGIIVIAGTGSIAFGKKNGQVIRAGGWGHVIGDEGSGYAIAVEAIKKVLHYADGYGEKTVLTKLLLEAINAKDVSGFIDYIYKQNFNKDTIASLSQLVDQAAEAGDLVAKTILMNASSELNKQVTAIIETLFSKEEIVPVVLNGSVIKNSKTFNVNFTSLFADNVTCTPLEGSAAIGAAYLAQKVGM